MRLMLSPAYVQVAAAGMSLDSHDLDHNAAPRTLAMQSSFFADKACYLDSKHHASSGRTRHTNLTHFTSVRNEAAKP